MQLELLQLLFYSMIGSVFALLGGLVFLYNKTLSSALSKNSIPFAAGVLLTVSLIGLIPEANHIIGDLTFIWVLGSFLIMYLFEHLFFGLHHHTDDCKHDHGHDLVHHNTSIVMVLVGDTIHNFIDGVAIGASFLINPGLGFVTAFSTFLHEVPHEIGDFGILLSAGWKKRNVILVNILSGSLTIIGAFIVYFLPIDESIIGVLMAISAGIFLYLGATDFLPQIEELKQDRMRSLIPLLFGVAIMYATLTIVPHSHESADHDDDHEDDDHEEEVIEDHEYKGYYEVEDEEISIN